MDCSGHIIILGLSVQPRLEELCMPDLHKDPQCHITSRLGFEGVLLVSQVASHQREQVAGLHKGVLPSRKVPVGSQQEVTSAKLMTGTPCQLGLSINQGWCL